MSTLLPEGFKLYADRDIRTRSVNLHMILHEAGHTIHALPISVQRIEDPAHAPEAPFVRLRFDQAEDLMAELWKANVRIKREFGDDERVAMKAHVAALEQEVLFLRGLVNHQLGIVR